MSRPARVFISYAHADDAHRKRLDVHLAPLRREGLIAPWHDRMIYPGSEWVSEIDRNLAEADVILLLVSADFIASDYCYEKEMALALDRHRRGDARVIPVFVEPTDFGSMPFGKLQGLPSDATPVSTWANRDQAWLEVAKGIRRAVNELKGKLVTAPAPAATAARPEQTDGMAQMGRPSSAREGTLGYDAICELAEHADGLISEPPDAIEHSHSHAIWLLSLTRLLDDCTDHFEQLDRLAHPADRARFTITRDQLHKVVNSDAAYDTESLVAGAMGELRELSRLLHRIGERIGGKTAAHQSSGRDASTSAGTNFGVPERGDGVSIAGSLTGSVIVVGDENTVMMRTEPPPSQAVDSRVANLLVDESPASVGESQLPGTSLLIDNWLIEAAGELLVGDFNVDEASSIRILPERDEHDFEAVPGAAIQVQALLALLSDIVFREHLVVDVGFKRSREVSSEMIQLVKAGIVVPTDFRQRIPNLPALTSQMVEQVCITNSMRAVQAKNAAGFRAGGARGMPHPKQSILMWGTAGYLARAHSEQLVYSGHPLRRRILSQTVFRQQPDAVEETSGWLRTQRVQLFESILPAGASRAASFVLPPVAVEAVEESASLSQLVPIAMQMRTIFAPLRQWLSQYQAALADEDPRSLLKHGRDLAAVAASIETLKDPGLYGATGLDMRVRWMDQDPSTSKPLSARALLGNLALAKRGEGTLKKLLRLLGEEHSTQGHATLDFLTRYYTTSLT